MDRKKTANRPECKRCISNKNGECIALHSTKFKTTCPFLATPERLQKDKELLLKAVLEGRVSEQALLYKITD